MLSFLHPKGENCTRTVINYPRFGQAKHRRIEPRIMGDDAAQYPIIWRGPQRVVLRLMNVLMLLFLCASIIPIGLSAGEQEIFGIDSDVIDTAFQSIEHLGNVCEGLPSSRRPASHIAFR